MNTTLTAYSVSISSLHGKIKQIRNSINQGQITLAEDAHEDLIGKQVGRPRCLTVEQENEIAHIINLRAASGEAISNRVLWLLAHFFNPVDFPLNPDRLRYRWISCFYNRHPELKLATVKAMDKHRYDALTEIRVDAFAESLALHFTSNSYDATRIYNCDETGLHIAHDRRGKKYWIGARMQDVERRVPKKDTHLTILYCGSAAGHLMKPMFITPRKRIEETTYEKFSRQGEITHSNNGNS